MKNSRIKLQESRMLRILFFVATVVFGVITAAVALDPASGKLAWYYQELPGDDWDLDHTHEKILFRTPFNPDPKAVTWINPGIPRGHNAIYVFALPEQR